MDQEKARLLVLVDGSSYLFRAYHALPPLNNSRGEPTGAMYGVLNMLRKLMKDQNPAYVAVIFDAKGKTFREDLYPQYKANREQMPTELSVQIKPLLDIIQAQGFPLLVIEGCEADDVIGTLAKQAEEQQLPVLISTLDKDLTQLVTEDVTIINTMTDKKLNPQAVHEKFGVPPNLIIDYLALVGDPIDNIPGVAKVGPKTAAKWLQEYGSLDHLMQRASEIKGKVGENLRAHLQEIPLSRLLATVKTDVSLDMKIDELVMSSPKLNELTEYYKRFEFKSWLSELLSEKVEEKINLGTRSYSVIFEKEEFLSWMERLQTANCFAFDTETTSLHAMQAELVGISFSIKPGEAAYVPLMHNYEGAPQQLNKQWVLSQIKPILENPKTIIIGQNLKYDYEVLRNCGIQLQAKMWDTLLESYVLNSTSTRHNMDALALKYLGLQTVTFEEVAGKGAKQVTFNQVLVDKATLYAAEDADVVLQLHQTLWPKIEAEKKLQYVLETVEWPLVKVLAEIEYQGVLIDVKLLQEQSLEIHARLIELQEQAYQIAGEVFNLGSPKQLQTILYEKLQLPVLARTPKGQASTAEATLQDLAEQYELPQLILEHRSLSKIKSTYTDALPLQVNPKTGRVHTSYNQAVTATGRLSSSDPNLQNIPIRTEEGRRIRRAFIAEKNHQLLAADYSQIELRLMAHLSQDPGLLEAFAKGKDIHAATAAEVFGLALAEVTDLHRRQAKAINFGLMYGMSSFGLAKQLGIDRTAAQLYIDTYFHRYPKVHEYMETARETAARQGYVETILGRRLYIPEIKVSNLQRRRAAERAAINAPLQGSAADIIKIAMIEIQQWIEQSHVDVKMIMQVHDELVFEVANECMDEAKAKIRHFMEHSTELSVPLIVDMGVGSNWDEAH
jgi:DNA polymerase-1